MKDVIGYGLVMMVWLLLILTGACNIKAPVAERLLKQEAVTEVAYMGYSWWACGVGDQFSEEFIGHKNGYPVHGSICGGWLKDYTIRYK